MPGHGDVVGERAGREAEAQRALRRAVRAEPAPAAVALAAREGGQRDDALARAEAAAALGDLARELVPHDRARPEEPALVHVEVAAADPARGDAQHDLPLGRNGIGHGLDGECARGRDDDGPHPHLPGPRLSNPGPRSTLAARNARRRQ